MTKLRVGVIVYEKSLPTEGGGHSYYETLLRGINDYDFNSEIEIVFIIFYENNKPTTHFKKQSIFIKSGLGIKFKDAVKKTSAKSSFVLTRRSSFIKFISSFVVKRQNKKVEARLRENSIDIIYYLKPEFDVLNYPFIATHWDIAHKSLYPFPEVALNGEYERRENYYLYTLNKAFVILCESEAGIKELEMYYTILSSKIKIVPIFPGDIVNHNVPEEKQEDILQSYHLQRKRFFIYPAQFWALKNHYNLILAFDQLLKEPGNEDLKLVLCGADKGNMPYIRTVIQSLSLTGKVIITDFVIYDELYTFYKNAIALAMPTFLGPTNMPLLEATYLGCPVICSDLEGHREILKNYALYFDPSKPDTIKNVMQEVLLDATQKSLSEGTKDYVSRTSFNLNNSLQIIDEVLLDLKSKRKTWGY